MKNWPTAKSISETPISGVFVAPDKYLRLQHFSITEPMPPISEDESIVFFVTSGEGRITINGVEFPLSTGSLCWLQSYHTYTMSQPSAAHLSLLSAYMTIPSPPTWSCAP